MPKKGSKELARVISWTCRICSDQDGRLYRERRRAEPHLVRNLGGRRCVGVACIGDGHGTSKPEVITRRAQYLEKHIELLKWVDGFSPKLDNADSPGDQEALNDASRAMFRSLALLYLSNERWDITSTVRPL